MTPAQAQAIEDAALALHAALHAVDESVSFEFAFALDLIDGTHEGRAIFQRITEVFRR